MGTACVFSILLALLATNVHGQTLFHSFNNFNVITDPPQNYEPVNYLFFGVQACNDATIWLTDEFGYYSTNSYGFTLGGVANQVFQVRNCWFCDIEIQNPITGLVNCNQMNFFWISWGNDLVSIGQGVTIGINTLLSDYPMAPGYVVSYVGFNTAHGATGTWLVPEQYFLSPRTPSNGNETNVGSVNDFYGSVVLQVQSCRDAIVALNQGDAGLNNDNSYQIAFGTFDDNSTEIRPCRGCPAIVRVNTPGIINCDTFSNLWVAWDGTTDTVWAGTGITPMSNTVITWTNSFLRPPRIDLMTVSGSDDSGDATWNLPVLRYDIQYNTEDGFLYYDIGWLGGETYMLIDVQSCQNAIVALTQSRTLTVSSEFYEFTIGAAANSQIILRYCLGINNCQVLASALATSPLNCNAFTQFWVYWDVITGDLGIGSGWVVGDNSLLYFTDPTFLSPTFAAVSTLNVVDGVWTFPREIIAKTGILATNPIQYTGIDNLISFDGGNTNIVFDIATTSNVVVTLENDPPLPSTIFMGYTFQIQNPAGQTVVSRCFDGVCTAMNSTATPTLFFPGNPTKFWVSWEGGVISLGDGWTPGMHTIVSYADPSPMTVDTMRMGSSTATANIRFPDGGCYRVADIGGGPDRNNCLGQ